MELKQAVDLERAFWLAGADHYREHLAEDFVMLFPGAGILTREQAISGIEGGQRWRDVRIEHERIVELGADALLLCYEASARRDDAPDYGALVSSAYVRRGGVWKLAFHQQSPIG